jgi:very-short-patch-repair endonuclease
MPRSPIDTFKRKTARRLRTSTTVAEAKLWRQLRGLETRGTHFRRQVPIGNFVVDFACMAARLVIEVDGSQHGEAAGRLRDAERTRWLEGQGYRVIRFWNSEVGQNLAGVLDVVHAALYGSRDAEPRALTHNRQPRVHPTPARVPRPDPPPPGEGEGS